MSLKDMGFLLLVQSNLHYYLVVTLGKWPIEFNKTGLANARVNQQNKDGDKVKYPNNITS